MVFAAITSLPDNHIKNHEQMPFTQFHTPPSLGEGSFSAVALKAAEPSGGGAPLPEAQASAK